MAGKILPVCNWLLKSASFLTLLERTERGMREDTLGVLGFDIEKQPRLIVPQGILVYQVTKEIRNTESLFFVVKQGDDISPAYLSISPIKTGNYQNTKLLECPWCNRYESSRAFDRLKKDRKEIVQGLEFRGDQHPILKFS